MRNSKSLAFVKTVDFNKKMKMGKERHRYELTVTDPRNVHNDGYTSRFNSQISRFNSQILLVLDEEDMKLLYNRHVNNLPKELCENLRIAEEEAKLLRNDYEELIR